MSKTTRHIAAELAPELDRLITNYLDGMRSGPYYKLRRFLFDNKVSILRVLEAHRARSALPGAEMRGVVGKTSAQKED